MELNNPTELGMKFQICQLQLAQLLHLQAEYLQIESRV